MSSGHALSETQNGRLPRTASHWLVELADRRPIDVANYECRLLSSSSTVGQLFLSHENGLGFPNSAAGKTCAVVFDGALYNRRELEIELGRVGADGNDADVVLAGYQHWGEQLFGRLRGVFALILWDESRELLFCLRDPLGTHPLFYAEVANGLVLSTSIEVLLGHPRVSRALNRAALADYFMDRFPRLEETFFEAVKRVPPGHVLCVGHEVRRSYRYWDPAPDGNVSWLRADEVEQFDEFLDRAVTRCLSLGKTGIFLSGGLDSVSVAAATLSQARDRQMPDPLALSLVFPQPDISEEVVQRSVATQLGLPHVVKPFYDAVGRNVLIEPAIELSATLPAPLMNAWLPAYQGLAVEGQRRGCRTILTGNGGDEWLTISPYLSADLMRSFNFGGIYRLGQNMRRSHSRTRSAIFRALLWRFGAQPLLLPRLHGVVKSVAPWSIRLRRRMFQDIPKWLAPEAGLRHELKQRREEYAVRKAKSTGSSLYIQEARKALDHPVISLEMEEYFNVYQRAGLRLLHPFWDADLVDLLFRTPPFMLDWGGRNKGLVRASLQRRFPNLGFERQVKLEATSFYASSVHNEAAPIWRKLTGATTLADLGVVDAALVSDMIERLLQSPGNGIHAHRVFSVLNLEAWARAHVS